MKDLEKSKLFAEMVVKRRLMGLCKSSVAWDPEAKRYLVLVELSENQVSILRDQQR